ncbi:MAG: hypothetical protein AW07_04442 [Candidatus Accumulibacter sp. SK-11]|nr:MAG: hypothetical protein AW07_04442 [Candidatus Accumulibacter sp. SK-11]
MRWFARRDRSSFRRNKRLSPCSWLFLPVHLFSSAAAADRDSRSLPAGTCTPTELECANRPVARPSWAVPARSLHARPGSNQKVSAVAFRRSAGDDPVTTAQPPPVGGGAGGFDFGSETSSSFALVSEMISNSVTTFLTSLVVRATWTAASASRCVTRPIR